jgi:Lar family restriction alleviation protein
MPEPKHGIPGCLTPEQREAQGWSEWDDWPPSLLECPFCGGEDIKKLGGAYAHGGGQSFMCQGCSAAGPWGLSHAEAVGQWNCRAATRKAHAALGWPDMAQLDPDADHRRWAEVRDATTWRPSMTVCALAAACVLALAWWAVVKVLT